MPMKHAIITVPPFSPCLSYASLFSTISLVNTRSLSYVDRYDGATDSSHVFFASINLEDGAGFYPGDGAGDLPITGGPPPFSKSGGAAASSNTAPALSPKSPKSPSPKSPSPKSPKSPSSYPPGSACEAELQEVEAASVLRQHIVRRCLRTVHLFPS